MAAVPRTAPSTQFHTGRGVTAPPRNFSGVDRDRDRDRSHFRGRGFAFGVAPGYYDYGYANDSCYALQWTPYGYRYVWVCDYDDRD